LHGRVNGITSRTPGVRRQHTGDSGHCNTPFEILPIES
jgi:hypothetical protein